MYRRDFLKQTGLALGATAATSQALAQSGGRISIVIDPADRVASAPPVRWAAEELHHAIATHGITVGHFSSIGETGAKDFCIVASGPRAGGSMVVTKNSMALPPGAMPDAPESFALTPSTVSGRPALLVTGSDARGLVYGMLEVADRLRHSVDTVSALSIQRPFAERPANTVRSISRMFVSDVEDKPWYNDREMWPAYLTMLASQRFNRFSLALGDWATTSCARSPTPTSCSPTRSFSPCPATSPRRQPARCRARPQPRDAEIHQRARRSPAGWNFSWASGCTATSGPTARACTPTTPSKG